MLTVERPDTRLVDWVARFELSSFKDQVEGVQLSMDQSQGQGPWPVSPHEEEGVEIGR